MFDNEINITDPKYIKQIQDDLKAGVPLCSAEAEEPVGKDKEREFIKNMFNNNYVKLNNNYQKYKEMWRLLKEYLENEMTDDTGDVIYYNLLKMMEFLEK